MDVPEIVAVLRRRWWLVCGLPVAVGLLSWVAARPAPIVVEARLRFAVDIPRSALVEGSDEGTAAKIGEALIDDVARILPSTAFAAAVARRLPAGTSIAPGELASDLSATDRHRVADVWARRTVPADASAAEVAAVMDTLGAVAQAAVAELEQNGTEWFARLGEDQVALTIIDGPSVTIVPPGTRARLELPLRIALALVLAVGLVFVWHGLDPAVRTEEEAGEAAGASVLAGIPRRGRFGRSR